MEPNRTRALLEALIFASEEPLSAARLAEALRLGPDEVKAQLAELQNSYREHHGLTVIEVAGGYRITCAPEFGETIRKIFGKHRQFRLTAPALETLAIVAYKQPLTRAEIEAIRGVATDGVIRTLLERNFIKIVGRKEELGRPFLFGTTRAFLEYFGLNSLADLPDAGELEKMVGNIEVREEEKLVETDPNAGRPRLQLGDEELSGLWAEPESAVPGPFGESGPAAAESALPVVEGEEIWEPVGAESATPVSCDGPESGPG